MKIHELYKTHGFIDADCIEFGEIILKECLNYLTLAGRDDCRKQLEKHFEINSNNIGA